MAQDSHKEKPTVTAAFPTLTKLDNTNTLDSVAAKLGWTREHAQEVLREMAIR